MTADIRIKICGLRTAADIVAATDAGATYIGFNFYPKSPRYVSFDQARDLAIDVPLGVAKVGLVVNADDALLDDLTEKVPLDMLQLHGSETPERVAEIRARYGLPVIKVLGVSGPDDLDAIDRYSVVADQLMLDAKPPKDAVLPGGNGISFDWTLLSGRKYWTKPWMLAGGLKPENVAQAIANTGTLQVDVASGVETAPGVKDAALMKAFCDAARGA
ncbi:phosphoribosylanthranilate isomerase [Loktanella sp. D2R18]|uniref:phosphoribosylanthranilate isomerase n=1 Tax=Rhodobacterales TaxID=204455 RepID=UPI000DEA34F9|nr:MULTISPECIES: phosphoribosylanthranilate isomerase [Rhodobacterales]MDO6589294.1 phosphoribosylanthranilate isomerase [Yoonia sp. 1_MG-2023]RBW45283.1 phosphoribosylanthranilate isomerase [Loktanella sp. D2R18]